MKKIVLMGNPNVGKSVVFSRLTGMRVITSNYPGTTICFTEGVLHSAEQEYMVIDAPGTYSLNASNAAEEIAVRIAREADLIVNVIDATNLERNLSLTLELASMTAPMIVALNLWDEAAHFGITIDAPHMEQLLAVPVVPTVALTGEGIKTLVSRIADASRSGLNPGNEEERWTAIGHIVRQVQRLEHKHLSLREWLADITIKPATGIPFACMLLLCFAGIIRGIGEALTTFVFAPVFEYFRPLVMSLSGVLGPGLARDIVIGTLIDGNFDYLQSMGILTTGLFVPFAMVLPYIVVFYALLGVLEDSGYLPRLATVADTLLHKLGMHGYGIVSLFLGLGCNVHGILALRGMETIKQRFIAAALIAIAVPCMAKTAMIFGVLGPYGFGYICVVFGVMTVLYIGTGLLLKNIIPGECQEIFLEIPPYRFPSPRAVGKKTWMRLRAFLAEAVPYLFLGVVLVNMCYALKIFDWLGHVLAPFIHGLLGLPETAAAAILMGFLRKDLAVGMLVPLGLQPEQLVVAVTILTMFFPCVGTFAVLFKELGLRYVLFALGIMLVMAMAAGGFAGAVVKIIL